MLALVLSDAFPSAQHCRRVAIQKKVLRVCNGLHVQS
jgi:hypothetical protein